MSIQIQQKVSLERQAFTATLVINNGLSATQIKDVGVNIEISDASGQAVIVTTDPNNTSASFFLRPDGLSGINATDGSGVVEPSSRATMQWLIIPAPGSGGTLPSGARYRVGATVSYSIGGQAKSIDVIPASITVLPQPKLDLDYFLPGPVYADDPFTQQIEPPVPFTLGVRVSNVGWGATHNTRINSAQPKIVDNQQGLLIGFQLLDSFVGDQPVADTLLADLGDIAPQQARIARWDMQTTLSGKFTDFSASYTHADSLGGALTSLINDIHTHRLVHDVRVDLPGRDGVLDFLALDGDVLRVYESDGADNSVTDKSAGAAISDAGNARTLAFPATTGLAYVKLTDPDAGQATSISAIRTDGKVISPDNIWYSRTRNADHSWSYFINLFDVDTSGSYTLTFGTSPTATLTLSAALSGARANDTDQFKVLVEDAGGNPLNDSASGTTQGTGSTVTTGTGTSGVISTVSGQTYSLREMAAGAPSTNLAQYITHITCTNGAADSRTLLPNGDGRQFSFAPAAGDRVACTLVNQATSTPTGTLTINTLLSPSSDPGLFNLQINGATVAQDAGNGGTSGAVTVANGRYSVGETAGQGTTIADYVTGISCSNGQSSDNALITAVLVPSAANVTCTISNTRSTSSPTLAITKTVSEPPSMISNTNDMIKYQVTVTNTASVPASYSLVDTPEFGIDTGIVAATVSKNAASPVDLPVAVLLATTANWALAADIPMAGNAVDTYVVSVTFAATHDRVFANGFDALSEYIFANGFEAGSLGNPHDHDLDCTLDPGETGTGLRNKAILTANGKDQSDSACAPAPDM